MFTTQVKNKGMFFLFKQLPKKMMEIPKQINTIKTIYEIEKDEEKLSIRNMSYDELVETRSTWAKQEGWPSVKYGMTATYKLDQDGFYFLECAGKKMASISVVSYPDIKLAYIGFFIVPKPSRGQGYGSLLFNKTMEYTEKYRGVSTFGLNCLESMSPMYQKWGFKTKTIDDIWKFTVKEESLKPDFINLDDKEILMNDMDDILFKNLISYDASIFGISRPEYLYSYINKPSTTTLIYQENDNIMGYGAISEREPANEEPNASYRIGPLYAKDSSIANALLTRLIAATNVKPNESVFLETPGTNLLAAPIVKMFGFEKIASMHKMYKGDEPKHNTEQIFCYSSLVTGG